MPISVAARLLATLRSLNGFRVAGDFTHMVAVLILLYRLFVKRNAQGISFKTQFLLFLVSVCRYLDIFSSFYSSYNTVIKLFYLNASLVICYAMQNQQPICHTYRKDQDAPTFDILFHAIMPSTVVAAGIYFYSNNAALMDNSKTWSTSDDLEVLWNFSIVLEPIALLPQIMMYRKYRQVESITGVIFLGMMGIYRGLYVVNWIYRAHTETEYKHNYPVYIFGILHVLLVCEGFISTSQGEAPSAPIWPQLKEFFQTEFPGRALLLCILFAPIIPLIILPLPWMCYAFFIYSYPKSRDEDLPDQTAIKLKQLEEAIQSQDIVPSIPAPTTSNMSRYDTSTTTSRHSASSSSSVPVIPSPSTYESPLTSRFEQYTPSRYDAYSNKNAALPDYNNGQEALAKIMAKSSASMNSNNRQSSSWSLFGRKN